MRDITEVGIMDFLPNYPLHKEIITMGKYTSSIQEDVDLLIKLGLAISAHNVLEIGTWNAETTKILAHYFDCVYTIDIAPKVRLDIPNVTHLIGNSLAFDTYNEIVKPLQLAFIDGGHEYKHVITDTFHALRLMDTNGIIAFHDVASWTDVRAALLDLSKVLDIYHPSGISAIDNIAFAII